MDLPEMFVSAIVALLVENLASRALSFIPYGGIDKKLNEWRDMLLTIEAVLADAEDRQFTEPSVQRWLHDVQNLVYEIEDFVDDFASEAWGRQAVDEPESSSRPSKLIKLVSGLFSSFTRTAISFSPATILRIGEITNSLKQLEKTKNKLGLREYVGGKSERTRDLRDPSTSLVDPDLVYGRKEDSAAILTWLLQDRTSDRDGNLHIISIVGMGGIGKTTLAQSLYNNEQMKDCFHHRVWVCVTEDFDILKISKIVYEDVFEKSCEFNDLNKVQEMLREKLSSIKCLLVLDDVWIQDSSKWDLLCAPFHASAPGSKIIITTRNHNVTKIMRSMEVHELTVLSDEDCLSLLAQHALGRPNFDGHRELKEVGNVIVKRCKGLPLAAKSLGGLLRTKGSSKQWMEVSTSKIWDLPHNGIIPALRLSYHHLPPYLKPLFVYCSLFPKGYEFETQELIMLWMAQGFLKQSSGEQKQMEELGFEYFVELLSRSFFQPSTGDDKSRYIMHDLNNDLAQFVAGLTYLRLDDEMVSNEQYQVLGEARHASFISHKYVDFKNFKTFKAARCLRTLLPIRKKYFDGQSYLCSLVLKDFPRLMCLRALSLNGYYIRELPKPIGDFHHLRYLDFSNTSITELPESICDLHNLQTLLLRGCSSLVQLPSSIPKLINLRHLDISDTLRLKEMPLGIGLLTHLHTLSKFIIDKSNGRKIYELKSLHHLQGTLSLRGIHNIINVQDAVEANLSRKEDLSQLDMKWSSRFGDNREKELEYKVLDVLKPPTKLASLKIELYGGQKFPSWIGDCSFCDMVTVILIDCKNCTYLPPLGQLTSLKKLSIRGMDKVKIVGPEFIGAGSPHAKAFRSLVNLSFANMEGWEQWSIIYTHGDEHLTGAFPCLQELRLSGCRNLNRVSLPKIPSLGSLDLDGCNEAVLRSMVGLGSFKELNVGGISGLSILNERIIRCLAEVEHICVYTCEELRYLWEEEVACQVLEKLKSLHVQGCNQLESLGDEEQVLPHNLESLVLQRCDKLEKMPNWQNSVTCLRRLTIGNCKKLEDNLTLTTSLETKDEKQGQSSSISKHREYEFSNLESVYISDCPSLKWFPTGKKLPTTLRYLSINRCENMEVPEEEGENGISLSLLESVSFSERPNLRPLTQGLAHLTRLNIMSCWGIESIPEGSLLPTLISLEIHNCPYLKYMVCANEMRSLTSLRQLKISGCKNLEGYPSGGRCWPPNLETLRMGEVKQPITEWGLATLPTSLLELELDGQFLEVVSLREVGTQLPRSLTHLQLWGFSNLECVGEGLENLASLRHLSLFWCSKLRELPETLLPTLSTLEVLYCPVISERCKEEKSDYWPKISHIPCIKIYHESMSNLVSIRAIDHV